jgi:hypothetical protein
MATATKSRRTRKSPAKSTDAATAKRIVRKAATKPASKPKAAAKPAAPKREQDSVTITMQRGKRDRQTRVIEAHEPTAGGGVRFEEISDNGASPVYLTQSDDKALGKPQKIRVTVKALA